MCDFHAAARVVGGGTDHGLDELISAAHRRRLPLTGSDPRHERRNGRQHLDALAAEGLEIGGLLRTDQGVFFAAVIERLSPPIWASDERLIVDVLTEASRLQTAGKQEQARPWAIAGVLMLRFLGLLALSND